MNELMVHVEQVVRPVRAGGARKLKMREELLAHLTAVYEEERARLGDDVLALQQAIRRFGDPAELRKELQATVPPVERFLTTPVVGPRWEQWAARWFHLRPNESGLRHAARVAAFFAGAVFALVAMIPVLRYATGVPWSEVRVDPAAAAVVTAHAFVTAMLWVGFVRATSGRLTTRAVLAAAASGALILAGGPVLLAALHALQWNNPLWLDLIQSEGRMLRVVLSGMFWLVGSAVVLRFILARQQRALEWTALEIDR